MGMVRHCYEADRKTLTSFSRVVNVINDWFWMVCEDPVETSARPTIGNQCRVMQMGWDCDILDNLPGILDKGIWKMLPEYDLLD